MDRGELMRSAAMAIQGGIVGHLIVMAIKDRDSYYGWLAAGLFLVTMLVIFSK